MLDKRSSVEFTYPPGLPDQVDHSSCGYLILCQSKSGANDISLARDGHIHAPQGYAPWAYPPWAYPSRAYSPSHIHHGHVHHWKVNHGNMHHERINIVHIHHGHIHKEKITRGISNTQISLTRICQLSWTKHSCKMTMGGRSVSENIVEF